MPEAMAPLAEEARAAVEVELAAFMVAAPVVMVEAVRAAAVLTAAEAAVEVGAAVVRTEAAVVEVEAAGVAPLQAVEVAAVIARVKTKRTPMG